MNIDKRLENLSEEIETLIDQKTEEELSREKSVIFI
jgi:hypothetical protein